MSGSSFSLRGVAVRSALLLALSLASAFPVVAATHTWTGAVSNLWSVNGNWIGGSPAGDPNADLVFLGPGFPTNVNDIPGVLVVNSIQLGNAMDFVLQSLPGSSIALATDIVLADAGPWRTHTLDVPVALYGGGVHKIRPVGFGEMNLVVKKPISGGPPDSLELRADHSRGGPRVVLEGSHPFSGPTLATPGTLEVKGSFVASAVQLNSWTPPPNISSLVGSGTVGPVSGNPLVFPGTKSGPGILTVSGDFGGAWYFYFDLNGTTPGTGYDRLSVTGNVTDLGGNLVVNVGFVPMLGDMFTVVESVGTLNGIFAGLPDGATFDATCATFQVHYTAHAATLTVVGGGAPLSGVSIATSGFRTVCPTSTGGTVTLTEVGGCTSTRQWGYRTASGGAITPIPGETGTSYVIKGADFPGVGTYDLVETTTPSVGSPITSNELLVTVVAAPVAVAAGSTTICLGQGAPLSGSGAGACSWSPPTGLSDPNSCAPVASPAATTTYTLTAIGGTCSSTNAPTVTVTVAPNPPKLFYTLPPCRLVDTRNAPGPLGAPALAPLGSRAFAAIGTCGVPATARALSANVTIVNPASIGDLRLFPGNTAVPPTSAINFLGGQVRANNAILSLSCDGAGTFKVQNDANGTVDLVVDVNGYFE